MVLLCFAVRWISRSWGQSPWKSSKLSFWWSGSAAKMIQIHPNPIQIPSKSGDVGPMVPVPASKNRGSSEISGYPWSLMMAFSQLETELMEERNHEDHDSWPTKIWWTAKIAKILKWTTNFCGRSQVAEKQMFKPWLQSLLMPWVIPCHGHPWPRNWWLEDAKCRDHHVSRCFKHVCCSMFPMLHISRYLQISPGVSISFNCWSSWQFRFRCAWVVRWPQSQLECSCQLSWCVFVFFPTGGLNMIENQAG